MVSFFASDGAFVNAVGPHHFGASYSGHDEIRSYFEPMFKNASDVRRDKSDIRVAGDKAYAQWRRHATLANGEKQDWLGTDVYIFQGDKILNKDTYIKVVA
jgi:ketosteroid isomerase-like protein